MKTLFIERTDRGQKKFKTRFTDTGVVGAGECYSEMALPVLSTVPDLVVIEGHRGSDWAENAKNLVQCSFPGVPIVFLAGETGSESMKEDGSELPGMIAIYEKTPKGRKLLNCKVTTGWEGGIHEDSNGSPFDILFEYQPLPQRKVA